ncbi:Ribokinase [uncultured Clostridium sp.]|uniref:ribokinase n=1 Tax=uncultured Clostridium sp. TaxID=59620 RepID=UPI000820A3E8|nr:ribokinase [uncultured Clostridium sp.]SCK03225.1 Ribokinase [uncultured Clostridium sp.]
MNKVCILGSMNMDVVIGVNNIPRVGETILANSFEKMPGGKGANQAVAAKRCGSEVYMISKIGKDENGMILKERLIEENINVDYIFEDDYESTGMAFITVNKEGDNSIIVVSGANNKLTEKEIDTAEEVIKKSNIIIAQLETSEEMTLKAFVKAKEFGKVTVLNPAPAKMLDKELLKYIDIIVPNETETEVLTGVKINTIDDAKKASEIFLDSGIKYVIITLGAKGAVIIGEDFTELVPAFKVDAIDTTAAGDSFIGGFSSKLDIKNISKETLINAVEFGNKVSSIAVQRKGAQPSIPYLEEVLKLYKD